MRIPSRAEEAPRLVRTGWCEFLWLSGSLSYWALAGYENALGAEHTTTLGTVNNLGDLYRDQGKLAEADQMYLRGLAGKKGLGGEHTSTLNTVNNLGLLCCDQGKLVEAEQKYQQVSTVFRTSLGSERPYAVTVRKNLQQLAPTDDEGIA